MGFPYSSVLQHSVLLVGSRTWLLFAIWRLFVCVVGRMRSVERKRKSKNAWSHTENPKRGAHAREPELSDPTLTWLPRTIRRGALTCVTWKRPSRFFVLYFSCNWFRHIKISPENVVEFLCFCFVIVESQSPQIWIYSKLDFYSRRRSICILILLWNHKIASCRMQFLCDISAFWLRGRTYWTFDIRNKYTFHCCVSCECTCAMPVETSMIQCRIIV